MKVIFSAIAIIILLLIITGITEKEPTNTAQRDYYSAESKAMANVMAEELVMQRLKSPATAVFSQSPDVNFIGDSTYIVKSYVDSQNGFGALLRMKFKATVKFMYVLGEKENWQLIAFEKLK